MPFKRQSNHYLKYQQDNIKYVNRINTFSYKMIFKIYYINWEKLNI